VGCEVFLKIVCHVVEHLTRAVAVSGYAFGGLQEEERGRCLLLGNALRRAYKENQKSSGKMQSTTVNET
jgi:hypothetical protein